MRFTLCALCVLFSLGTAVGQPDMVFPAVGSFTAASPEAQTVGPAALLLLKEAQAGCQIQDAASLNVLMTEDVDAASDGSDYIPSDGLAIPMVGLRTIAVEYSIGYGTTMAPPNQMVGCNAIFAIGMTDNIPYGPIAIRTGLGTSNQSDVDALSWQEDQEIYMYISLEKSAAVARGFTGGDILKVNSSGAIGRHIEHTDLGLNAHDDVDAVSIDKRGYVVFSVAPNYSGLGTGLDPAGLYLHTIGTVGSVPYLPGALGISGAMTGSIPNVNAVRISDPLKTRFGQGNALEIPNDSTTIGQIPAPNNVGASTLSLLAEDYVLLRVNGQFGNLPRRVAIDKSEPWTLSMDPPNHVLTNWAIMIQFGRPGHGEAYEDPVSGGNFVYLPDWAGGLATVFAASGEAPGGIGGQGYLPWSMTFPAFQIPYTVTFQGLIWQWHAESSSFKIGTTNAVTLQSLNHD